MGEELNRQAAEWFLIVRDARDPPAQTLQEWNRWLNASEANRAAFEAVAQTYHLTIPSLAVPLSSRRLAGQDEEQGKDDYDGSTTVVEWLAARGAIEPQIQRFAPKPRRLVSLPIWRRSLAAMAVFAALGIVWLSIDNDAPRAVNPVSTFATRTGEHMDLLLPDRSRVTLGARSRLHIDFDGVVRDVRLENGEAFFDVAKDAKRPFVVRALGGVITAVGTAFNVRATEDRVTVAVTEGVVRLANNVSAPNTDGSPRLTADGDDVRLSLGEQVSFSSNPTPTALHAARIVRVEAEDATRWREGWLIYRNERLRYVIADVSRYTDLQVGLSDTVGDDLRFTGAVFKDNVNEWIMALPKVFPVAIDADRSGLSIEKR